MAHLRRANEYGVSVGKGGHHDTNPKAIACSDIESRATAPGGPEAPESGRSHGRLVPDWRLGGRIALGAGRGSDGAGAG